MANLRLNALYGTNSIEYMRGMRGISMQFHITAQCDQNCIHCYMYNSKLYINQIKNSLSIEKVFALIDEYIAFLDEFDIGGLIALTGGDPILSPYYWELLEYIHNNYNNKIQIFILGNSYHITEEATQKMKILGVAGYQISLDGMQEKHDYFRKAGSFQDSIRALKLIHNAGLKSIVSFTLSKFNSEDLLPLYEYLNSLDFIDSFGFDRMIPTGNASTMEGENFTALEYRDFLFKILKYEMIHNPELVLVGNKEKMWKLLMYELGLADPMLGNPKQIISGCMAGIGTFSVLADGTILPCRKTELIAGKYPEERLKDILMKNEVTRMFCEYNQYEGCSECELIGVCRGCGAMKYTVKGDLYAKEPYCWRE